MQIVADGRALVKRLLPRHVIYFLFHSSFCLLGFKYVTLKPLDNLSPLILILIALDLVCNSLS